MEVTRLGHLIRGGGVRSHRRAYGSDEAWSPDKGGREGSG